VALHEGANVIGREEGVAAWIQSASVSRQHARIVVSGGKATLEDLGSKNGTFFRGERITSPVVLANGEEIRVGVVSMRFRAFEAADSTRTLSDPRLRRPARGSTALACTFAVDLLACPKCQGRMRLLAMVEDPANVARFLAARRWWRRPRAR
jgi:FHA domain